MEANSLIYFVQMPTTASFILSSNKCQGSPSEVGLHVGHHLRWGGRGVGQLGGVGELQLLQPLDIVVTQGQKLHVALLHGVWLLERTKDTSYASGGHAPRIRLPTHLLQSLPCK